MQGDRVILGIESSCDDTAAAVVRAPPGPAGGRGARLRGAGPGRAARRVRRRRARDRRPRPCRAAGPRRPRRRSTAPASGSRDLDAVAVTAGPGLIGGVLAGVMFAKGLAAGRGLPLYGVNHLAGHALTPRLIEDVAFPYLVLLVSGGHCQFLAVEGPDRFRRLGGTIDDAPGEAFDKVAKLLGLAPARRAGGGGARRARATRRGSPCRGRCSTARGATSPSPGLKTAVRRARDRLVGGAGRHHPRRPRRPLRRLPGGGGRDPGREDPPRLPGLPRRPSRRAAGAGGRRRRRRQRAASGARSPRRPRREGAGVPGAAAGALHRQRRDDRLGGGGAHGGGAGPTTSRLPARPRWPLDAAAAPMLGAGRKGAKA